MSPIKEIRSLCPGEAVDWMPITDQEGQIRFSQELQELSSSVIEVMEQDENSTAVLIFDQSSEPYDMRRKLRNAVERLSGRKVQTKIISIPAEESHPEVGMMYLRFRPTE